MKTATLKIRIKQSLKNKFSAKTKNMSQQITKWIEKFVKESK